MLSFESRAMEIDRSFQRVKSAEEDFSNSQANVWNPRNDETDGHPEEGLTSRLVVSPPTAWRTEESLPSPPPSPALAATGR